AVFGDLNQTLITFFLCAFLTLRLPFGISKRDCAKQKPWFIYLKFAVNKSKPDSCFLTAP
ncbi:MAG: hypothetical protein ACK5HC_05235, partial [Dolichospermum sp.]